MRRGEKAWAPVMRPGEMHWCGNERQHPEHLWQPNPDRVGVVACPGDLQAALPKNIVLGVE